MYRFIGVLAFTLIFAVASTDSFAGEKFITIGTASELGVYYPAGGAICRLVKRGIKEHGLRCFVEPTSGAVYNLRAIHANELDLGIVQTDWLYNAYHGTGEFAKDGSNPKLRSVFSMHTEAFTVLTRAGAGIKSIQDLKGKTVGIGNDGSGMQATAEQFMKAEGWDRDTFREVVELKPVDLGKALCAGTVDAIFFTTGHPNGATQEITRNCPTHILSVTGPKIDKLLHDNPYYFQVTIPGGMYAGSLNPVQTFGVKATLVTSSDVDDDVVYQVVKAVFDNLDNFKTLHPVFATLDKNTMVSEGLIVPLHPGALKYYREAGLLK